MIHWLHLKNFRSLRNTRINFAEPLTAIIGANNTGKSSILVALSMLRSLAHLDLPSIFQGLNTVSLLRTQGVQEPIEFAVNIDYPIDGAHSGQYEYRLSLQAELTGSVSVKIDEEELCEIDELGNRRKILSRRRGNNYWDLLNEETGLMEKFHGNVLVQGIRQLNDRVLQKSIIRFRETMGFTWFFDFIPNVMRNTSPISPDPILGIDGSNLAAVVDWLKSEHPAAFDIFKHEMKRLVPEIDEIVLRTVQGGTKYIALKEKTLPFDITSFQTSGGILRLLGMLAAIHSPQKPYLIALEEPENGFHPRRLEQIVECLRDFARQKLGGVQRQVIVTTHAPNLLNWLRPEEILVATRTDNGTEVSKIGDLGRIEHMLEEATLGEIWHRGSIGGVPTP